MDQQYNTIQLSVSHQILLKQPGTGCVYYIFLWCSRECFLIVLAPLLVVPHLVIVSLMPAVARPGSPAPAASSLPYNETTCGQGAFARGPGQRVIAFSFYGDPGSGEHQVVILIQILAMIMMVTLI